MERNGENFSAGKAFNICPLCKLHIDSQDLCFQCQVIKEELKVEWDISNIYNEYIDQKVVNVITRI